MIEEFFGTFMWTNGDPMRIIGTLVAGGVAIIVVVLLMMSFVRRLLQKQEVPVLQTDLPRVAQPTSVDASQLESMRQTLWLPPKVDEGREREHARRVLAKGRVRRFFGK